MAQLALDLRNNKNQHNVPATNAEQGLCTVNLVAWTDNAQPVLGTRRTPRIYTMDLVEKVSFRTDNT